MTSNQRQPTAPRVYPLDNRDLTEEQIAVTFAMTSRSPEPFDQIAQTVSEEKAADFNERWVLDYGHASVAEHAVVHLAVENISRLACDALEDNRLASYTEKSSRYQVIEQDSFHTPSELDHHPRLRSEYRETCLSLFTTYQQLIEQCVARLRETTERRSEERTSAYELRLGRAAIDGCRAILPASTLTNAGVTANARTLEHAISKLLSSNLKETRELAHAIRDQGRSVTPTLIKYAQQNKYLQDRTFNQPLPPVTGYNLSPDSTAQIVDWDDQAQEKLAAALLYRHSGPEEYQALRQRIKQFSSQDIEHVIAQALQDLGPHDAPPRAFEVVDYTFEFIMDYGALREFRRHRMQTPLSQPLTATHGIHIPPVIRDTGLEYQLAKGAATAEKAFRRLSDHLSPTVAQYVVTHAHQQRILAKMNLRECYHLFRLRTSDRAHESVRTPMKEALRLAYELHPALFRPLISGGSPDTALG